MYLLAKRASDAGLGQLGNPNANTSLLMWTTLYRAELRAGRTFSLHDHLYLKDIYECTARSQVYKKGGQIGISELLVSLALYVADVRKGDVLYIMPTGDDVSDFSRMRFGPALEVSDYLNSLVTQPSHGKMRSLAKIRGADKVSLKRVRDNWLIFRGGTVQKDGRARQLKSVPADLLIADELDEMDERALSIARKRLGHSAMKMERLASTPTFPGVGIDAEWNNSDMREWYVPCAHCGHRQQLLFWEHVVLETNDMDWPTEWNGKGDNRAFVACEKCGREINHLAAGEWVATYSGRDVVGFHPTKMMASHTPLIDIVNSFRTTNETKRREATNQHLGETFTPKGGVMTDEVLNKCVRPYSMGVAEDSGASMGVDVGDLLHVIIRGRLNDKGHRPLLYAGELGRFYELDQLIKLYGDGTCVIDAAPEKKKAREFQSNHSEGLVWLCYYLDLKQSEIAKWDWRNAVVNADRTWSLDTTMARFYDGGNIFPEEIKNITNYYKHMKASIRIVVDDANGNKTSRYINNAADHFAHAENYCTIAAMRDVGWAR